MSPRTLFTALLVTALPFAAVACGDDEPEATKDPTTTTVDDSAAGTSEDTAEDDATDTPDVTTDDETGFAEGLVEARTRLDAATSICDLAEISDYVDEVGEPEGAEEIQAAVDFQADLWTAIADSAPAEFAAQGEVIRGVAEDFRSEAASVDYDFEAIGQLESINSTEFSEALSAFYQQTVENC